MNATPGQSRVRDERIVIVTGSNGRIGDAVMRRFAGRFSAVIGTDRRAPEPPPDCVYVPVEVTSDESVRDGLETIGEHHGKRVASVVHLAAYYDFAGGASEKYEQVTVRGTRRLLRSLHALGFEVEQFLFSSTMLVHRPGRPGEIVTEDSPQLATWAYPQSKVRTEEVIREERGAIPAVFHRIAGVYDDECHSIPISEQMQRIYERRLLTSRLYSASTAHGQNFVHMDDVVEAIALTVERRAELPPELPVLIGEPETLSYDEIQHTLARLIHGRDWETWVVPAPLAKVGAVFLGVMPGQFIKPWMIDRAGDHYALDITRARTLLGWEPQRSLRATLPLMVEALKRDPAGWYREHGLAPPRPRWRPLRRVKVPGASAQPHAMTEPGRQA